MINNIFLDNNISTRLKDIPKIKMYSIRGGIHKVIGPVIEAKGIQPSIGDICNIYSKNVFKMEAEVLGFRDEYTILIPIGSTSGISRGDEIEETNNPSGINISNSLLGRVISATGEPMDGKPLRNNGEFYPIKNSALNPCERSIISQQMKIGIKSIDALNPVGVGQRMGIFAGAGVGKSSVMGMIAKGSSSDINVIALVGERGREVNEFLQNSLGKDALKNSIVIISTADQSPVLRVRAALLATTISEYFRDQGKNVMLMMDSLTRFAQAQRELGLMLGEPPTTKGYTPSCFTSLAEMLERAGPGKNNGNITALYTVLVEGDDISNDPIADSVMAILDGHIVLSREIAEAGIYPAINIPKSISRLSNQILKKDVLLAGNKVRGWISNFKKMEDMINMGIYESGSNTETDLIISKMPEVIDFLKQPLDEILEIDESHSSLMDIANVS